ncbi:MAG: hypothetical protein ABIY37_10780 [Devosia sp.]
MERLVINKAIAGAIVFGRASRITPLRKIAEASLGPLSDSLWQRVEPEWQSHDAQTDQVLQAAILAASPTFAPD